MDDETRMNFVDAVCDYFTGHLGRFLTIQAVGSHGRRAPFSIVSVSETHVFLRSITLNSYPRHSQTAFPVLLFLTPTDSGDWVPLRMTGSSVLQECFPTIFSLYTLVNCNDGPESH